MKRIVIFILCYFISSKTFCCAKFFQDSLTVYLAISSVDKNIRNDSVRISYNINYPLLKFNTYLIRLDSQLNNNCIKIKVPVREFQVDFEFVSISDGDTIFLQQPLNAGKIVLSNRNKKTLFFKQAFKKNIVDKHTNPSNLLNKTPFNYKEYKDSCYYFFNKELLFIDSFISNSSIKLKNFYIERSKNNLFELLIKPYVSGKIPYALVDVSLKEIIDSNFVRLNKLPTEPDYSYRITLSTFNTFLSQLTDTAFFSVKGYELIVKKAQSTFSNDVYLYRIMSDLKVISRKANKEYSSIAKKMWTIVNQSNLNYKIKKDIKEIYSQFVSLSKSLYDFNEIIIIGINGEKTKLGNVLPKNKYIIIDFWASWCGPCIAEFPYFDSAKIRFPDVDFISLSIDDNMKAWEFFVTSNKSKLSKIFLIANRKENALLKNYTIKEIPRFLLFNKKGKCISASFHRPSEPQFYSSLKAIIN